MSNINLRVLHSEEALPFLNDIAQMRIKMFKEFPYLYDGSIEYEKEYLYTYFNAKTSTIILGFAGEELVAFSSSIALKDELDEIKQPFIDNHLSLEEYFYIGEMMIKSEYRTCGILPQLKQTQENIAKQNNYKHIVFMTVHREKGNSMRPIDYKDLSPLWHHFGYKMLPNMRIDIPWQRVDTGKEEMNALDVWYKKI